jgi:hypothetical protein
MLQGCGKGVTGSLKEAQLFVRGRKGTPSAQHRQRHGIINPAQGLSMYQEILECVNQGERM